MTAVRANEREYANQVVAASNTGSPPTDSIKTPDKAKERTDETRHAPRCSQCDEHSTSANAGSTGAAQSPSAPCSWMRASDIEASPEMAFTEVENVS